MDMIEARTADPHHAHDEDTLPVVIENQDEAPIHLESARVEYTYPPRLVLAMRPTWNRSEELVTV